MALDLSDTLVVGISSTALFDLSEADGVFQSKYSEDKDTAIDEYRKYMLLRENDPLDDGTGMPLVEALLKLNKHQGEGRSPLVEVVVMSRNSPETGVRVLHNIRRKGLSISRHAFTGGESVVDYLEAFDVDLFLTTNVRDAQRVIDGRTCAAAIVKKPPEDFGRIPEGHVRIAFDGDAVLFDESSEIVYRAEGLNRFLETEDRDQDVPLPEGPYATLLEKLSRLQKRLPFRVEYSPVRIAIVTARNAPAEMRVIKTLRHWGVYVNEIFFLGGVEKAKVLKAFRPHIFFDDQDLHLEAAANVVPSCRVPYQTGSTLALTEKLHHVFAYGSNMSSYRFRDYFVTPKAMGRPASIKDYRLCFNKKSTSDGSGKANIEHCAGAEVWGVMYQISEADLHRLDAGEGGYVRQALAVCPPGESPMQAWVYLAGKPQNDPPLRPYSWYAHFLIEGAIEHRLPAAYIDALRQIEVDEDPDLQRDKQKRALISTTR